MSNLENALKELREKRSRAQVEIEKLDQIISGIESLNGTGATGEATQPIRIISASSRRKMALAQKARWASVRKQSQPIAVVAKTTGSAPAKRTMSVAARRKIAATQKARWAKIRAQQKKAA
jgi:phosphopantothenoylcysteine synthetase/decarboxylase